MNKGRLYLVAGATAAALALAAAASAHEGATGIVKQRMDAMSNMGKRAKAMKLRLRAGRDLAAIKNDAEEIHKLAAGIAPLFPPGSLSTHSEARKAIWQDWPDFSAKADALAAETAKLAGIAPDNIAALSKQMRAVTDTCVACHETYRLKK